MPFRYPKLTIFKLSFSFQNRPPTMIPVFLISVKVIDCYQTQKPGACSWFSKQWCRIFLAPSQSPHINPSPAFGLLLPCSLPDSPISLHVQPLSNPSPITPLDHLKTLTVDRTRFLLSLSLFLFPDVSTTSISDEIVALAFFHAPIF